MRYTNRHNLPQALVKALENDTYSRGESRRSVTQLIDSPKVAALKEAHEDELEVDVSDRIWAMFGTAVHKMIEDGSPEGEGEIREERIFTEVGGWMISGAIDLQVHEDGGVVLTDWKTTSAYAVQAGKESWELQLNTLAYLLQKERGLQPVGLEIGALIKDWSRREAIFNRSYPQTPIIMIPIPRWPYEEQRAYVEDRVRLHQEADRALEWGDDLPPCTAEEQWSQASKWAVMQKGKKRALKICDNETEANALAADESKHVEHRPGELVRCSTYCEVNRWCNQWRVE